MEILTRKKDFNISTEVFHKICREFKNEIKDAKKEIEKLNELDYQYNKKIVYLDKLLETVDFYLDKESINEGETKNLMVVYYGNPVVTIELCLTALMKGQMINLVIDDMCLGVNKLLVELYKELLKEYKIFDIVSFNNYESKEKLEENKKYLDKIFLLGDKNLYNICKHISDVEVKYVPYNIIDIYCEDDSFYDLAREIFNYCFENSVEAEIYEDMSFDEVVEIFNNYGEKYCSIILTKSSELAERFRKEVKSKFVYVNENPFKDENIRIPEIF